EAIINEAYNRRVVMLNEAHHVPETRGLTMALLKPLFDQGYRYFAAETFQEIGLKETIKKGFPMLETGYYIAEPLFADIVREALRIGYTLVPYEHSAPCDYSVDPDGCQDQRERGQAKNLYDRTLKKDPSA